MAETCVTTRSKEHKHTNGTVIGGNLGFRVLPKDSPKCKFKELGHWSTNPPWRWLSKPAVEHLFLEHSPPLPLSVFATLQGHCSCILGSALPNLILSGSKKYKQAKTFFYMLQKINAAARPFFKCCGERTGSVRLWRVYLGLSLA